MRLRAENKTLDCHCVGTDISDGLIARSWGLNCKDCDGTGYVPMELGVAMSEERPQIVGTLAEMGPPGGDWLSVGEPPVRLSIDVTAPDARSLGAVLFGRVEVARHEGCRRCTECPDAAHHWMAMSLEDEGEIVEPERVVWACKHCDFHMPWDDPDEPEDQYQRSRRYPLWCVDTGDKWSEQRYRGPFKDLGKAEGCLHELNDVPDPEMHPDAKIRRCRRILPSDLASVKRRGEFLTEDMDENAAEDAPPHQSAWADWGESLLRPKLRASAEADAGFLRWADEFLETNMFLCEGDEEPSE